MLIHFKNAEYLDLIIGLGKDGSVRSGELIDNYIDWLDNNGIAFKFVCPFIISVDDRYEHDIIAFKLTFGL